MPCVKRTEANSATGRGTRDGTSVTGRGTSMAKTEKDWDSFLPFYSQWYWQEALMHPYERTKAYYHGPRCDWMNLMEDDDDTDSA